jgi:hypothetical protein
MKSVFIFLFSIVYLQTLAQAVPDYSFAAFGLSNDVVKSEEITYEYSDLDNKYIDYEKIVLTFQNGLLTEKVDNYSGLYASTTKTNYTYLNGKISKEVRTYSYSGTTTIYTTNYIYKNGKLTEMNYDDSEGRITRCMYFYDAQGKLDKSETRNSIGELINISDYSNVSNEKNYTQMTSYYYGGNLTATDVNTDTYVNGKISSSQSESLDYGEIYYDYEYDTHGNVLKITEDYLDTEVNDYEYDTKGNWIKCKNYSDDWWMGEVEKYKFRKITFKTGTSGSTAFDQNFFNKFPSNVDNDLAEPTTPKQTLPDTPKSSLNPGCEGNCTDGYGTYFYADGGSYEGFFKNSYRNGPGMYTFPDGSNYAGNWVNGKKEGYGMYGWSDGAVYCGQYVSDNRSGEGIYIDENKVVKGGIFKDGNFEQTFYINDNGTKSGCISGDCNNGFGKIIYSKGDVFVGFFKNGQMSHGIYVYTNKDSYIGEFSYGKKHGIGIYTWSDQSFYLGMYQNDTYQGLGIYDDYNTPANNQIGEFRNGSLYLKM